MQNVEQEFTHEELVSLALIALEVDEPVDHIADRFSEEIVLDDVGMRAVSAAAARQFFAERAAQNDRMRAQALRIEQDLARTPHPAPIGVPALSDDATPLESLMAGDSVTGGAAVTVRSRIVASGIGGS